MTSPIPASDIPPGHIDLRPLKPLCREYRQIFEFIAGGGAIAPEYVHVGEHPVTLALNKQRVHPIRSDRGSALGICLGNGPLREGDRAITFVLGTHPNELSAWDAAKAVIDAFNKGEIPNDIKINLVIGGAKNGVTEKDASGQDKPNIRVSGHHSDPSRKGGIRGMFRAIETKDFMSIAEYTEYRTSPHNWNRVMLEKELAKLDPRITDLEKYDADPAMAPVIERRDQLKKHAYAHSHAIMDFHSLSQPAPILILLQTQWDHPEIALPLLQKRQGVLTPTPLTPNILTEMLDTYAPGVSSMPLLTSDPNGTLSLCVETGGPHWDMTTIQNGGKVAMHMLRCLANELHPGSMAPTQFTQAELTAFQQAPIQGIYRKPLGIFHPKFQPNDSVREQYLAAAAEQKVDWAAAKEDTYILIRGNLQRPFDKILADQIVEKQRSRTDKTTPALNRHEIHNYLYALPGKLRAYLQQHQMASLPGTHLGTLQPIRAGEPIMIGLKTGFIVPSPKLEKGSGFSLFAPADGILTPEFYEQILFLMRERAPTLEAALAQERKPVNPEANDALLRANELIHRPDSHAPILQKITPSASIAGNASAVTEPLSQRAQTQQRVAFLQ